MENNLFTVELIVNQYLHIVFFLLNINWYINTITSNFDWYGPGIILIFKKQSKFLVDLS